MKAMPANQPFQPEQLQSALDDFRDRPDYGDQFNRSTFSSNAGSMGMSSGPRGYVEMFLRQVNPKLVAVKSFYLFFFAGL